MKNWPHGVSVVPMAAMTVKIHRLFHWMYGCVAPCSAAPQSGLARMPGDDVGEQHEAEDEEHPLHLAVRAAGDEQPDAHGDDGHGHVGRHVEEAARRGDARELRHGGAEVGDHRGEDREGGDLEAEVLADEAGEPASGDDADAGVHLLDDGEDGRDQHQQPDHAVAVARADHRPGGDAAGVVAGVGGDEAGPHHRQDDEEPGAADAAGQPQAAYPARSLRHRRGLLNGRSSAGASSRRAEAPGRWRRRW